MRLAISAGDVIRECVIFADNDFHWFLKKRDRQVAYYDIVMPKDEVALPLKVGDNINVVVKGINIVDDGTPGVFVKPVENKCEDEKISD